MSNERLYYIQAADQWLTYSEAHEYGYTLSKPLLKTYYTQDLQPVQIRVDSASGELYDLRAQAPHSWVTDINSLNLYRLVGDVALYTADKSNTYSSYSSSISSDESDNIAYNGEVVSYEDLYNNFGITKHPCNMYLVQDGRILSWHDPETNLYWNVSKKSWDSYPPSQDTDLVPQIFPLPDPILPFEQWDSQLPSILSVTGRFIPSFESSSLSPSYKDVPQWEDYQNTFNLGLYINISKNNIKIYVIAEEGVEDYLGNHLSYGDNFIGDYECLYIEQGSSVSPRERIRSQSFYGDQDWRDLETTKFSIKNPNSLGIIRLNGQWKESFDSSIIAEAGTGYIILESFSNYHVPSSVAEMFIDILVESTITFKAMSRSEHGYDYVRVFGITDEIIFNGQNISTFTEFTVSGKGTIRVQYIKDGSANTEPDKGFLAVPEDFIIED